jgi:recombinational DNA repair protein RecT
MSCTNESIYNALLDMAVQGLNPGKKQCYFIAYGNQLLLQRSYMGTVMVAKRLGGIKDVHANVVYLGDEFKYDVIVDGGVDVTSHSSALENRGPDKIIAAYAAIRLNDGGRYTELMTISEIKKAWGQGATRGNSPAHQNFPEEMAKKTVINRACKLFVNTSDDSDLLSDSFNRTTDNEYDYGKTDTQGPAALPENASAASGEAARMDALLFGGADAAPDIPEPAHEEKSKDEPTSDEDTSQVDAEFEARMQEETREVFGE